MRFVFRPAARYLQSCQKVPSRLRDKCRLIPIGARIGPRCIYGMSGSRGEAAMPVYLPHLVSDRIELVAIDDRSPGR